MVILKRLIWICTVLSAWMLRSVLAAAAAFVVCRLPLKGAQWLSGRVLDSRPRGRWFEPHWRHCIVVLKQDTFILA